MHVTSIQAPLSLLPQSHPDCQTTQHPSHVCLAMLMLTMDSQENLFNSVSLIISPHPSPISPSSYFIWESPIPELSVFTLHYSDGLPFTLPHLQFPLQLAFSMTINKSQGQSVWFVGIDLCSPVFTHGQLYVALSRATSGSQVKVLLPQEEAGTVTKNVVYREALLTQ